MDPSDPNFIKARSRETDLSFVHRIFGDDLDAVIVRESDPNVPNAKDASKCQQAVAQQAKKCQNTMRKEFLVCRKGGMKGKTPPGPVSNTSDLERLCLRSDPNDPASGQADPRGKIAKQCDEKLASKIQKKCAEKGVDPSLAFPSYDPNQGTLEDFVGLRARYEACQYWNAIDGLAQNCDLFDDGFGSASAVLYGTDRDGSLFTIDLTTGLGTLVGTLPSSTTEIEWDPIAGRAFLQASNGSFFAQEFDITTGGAVGSPVGNGGAFNGLELIAGALFGASVPGPMMPSTLSRLDPLTGTSIPIGLTGLGPIAGLAFDPSSETLYGIEGGPGPADLLTLDLASGMATVIGSTGIQAGSLEFGPDGGLYAGGTSANGGDLFRVDPSSGASSLVGATGFATLTGLTLLAD